MIDLLPAGPKLQQAKRITWPESGFQMSLVGFDHVFKRAIPFQFADGVQYRVAPLPVIAFLKIIAFMEDQHRRRKDPDDVAELFRRYEETSGRIFSDEVFSAELEDIEYANAFLLGLDVGAMATGEEKEILEAFVRTETVTDDDLQEPKMDDLRQREVFSFQQTTASVSGWAATQWSKIDCLHHSLTIGAGWCAPSPPDAVWGGLSRPQPAFQPGLFTFSDAAPPPPTSIMQRSS